MAEVSSCPNCGTKWTDTTMVCPNCGYLRPAEASWPPPPTGLGQRPISPLIPLVPKLVTGTVWGDITLGVSITLASFVIYCLGLIVMPILYFSLRAQYPIFTRGIGYGLLGGAVIALGALGVCLYTVNGTGH